MCITEWIRLEGTRVRHLFQPSCSNRVILEYKAQNCVQIILELSQWRRPHNLCVKSVLGLSQVLLYSRRKGPVHPFVLFASCPIAQHHQAEPESTLLTLSLQILIDIDQVPAQSSPLLAEQAQLPQPLLIRDMLQSPCHRCCHLASEAPCLCCAEKLRSGHSAPNASNQGCAEEQDDLP